MEGGCLELPVEGAIFTGCSSELIIRLPFMLSVARVMVETNCLVKGA